MHIDFPESDILHVYEANSIIHYISIQIQTYL